MLTKAGAGLHGGCPPAALRGSAVLGSAAARGRCSGARQPLAFAASAGAGRCCRHALAAAGVVRLAASIGALLLLRALPLVLRSRAGQQHLVAALALHQLRRRLRSGCGRRWAAGGLLLPRGRWRTSLQRHPQVSPAIRRHGACSRLDPRCLLLSSLQHGLHSSQLRRQRGIAAAAAIRRCRQKPKRGRWRACEELVRCSDTAAAAGSAGGQAGRASSTGLAGQTRAPQQVPFRSWWLSLPPRPWLTNCRRTLLLPMRRIVHQRSCA